MSFERTCPDLWLLLTKSKHGCRLQSQARATLYLSLLLSVLSGPIKLSPDSQGPRAGAFLINSQKANNYQALSHSLLSQNSYPSLTLPHLTSHKQIYPKRKCYDANACYLHCWCNYHQDQRPIRNKLIIAKQHCFDGYNRLRKSSQHRPQFRFVYCAKFI